LSVAFEMTSSQTVDWLLTWHVQELVIIILYRVFRKASVAAPAKYNSQVISRSDKRQARSILNPRSEVTPLLPQSGALISDAISPPPPFLKGLCMARFLPPPRNSYAGSGAQPQLLAVLWCIRAKFEYLERGFSLCDDWWRMRVMVIGKSSYFQTFIRGWKKEIKLDSEAESLCTYFHARF